MYKFKVGDYFKTSNQIYKIIERKNNYYIIELIANPSGYKKQLDRKQKIKNIINHYIPIPYMKTPLWKAMHGDKNV